MNITIQDMSENVVSTNLRSDAVDASETIESDRSAAGIADIDADKMRRVPGTIRKFQPLRFATGLFCTASGVALILGVGLRVMEMNNVGADFTMPLIGISLLIGVMLVGGGFGVMATSSSGFDEDEFDRLATAGNISAVSQSERSDSDYGENQDAGQTAA